MKKSEYSQLKRFSQQRILIVGDVMIDAYLFGKVSRISPEAPVPVVELDRREDRLGGAANVALNVQALGAEPVICSVIGKDDKAKTFLRLLKEAGISSEACVQSAARPTTTKFRILGNQTQLLRVDEETTSLLLPSEEKALLSKLKEQIFSGRISAVILQDYDKGVLTPKVIQQLIEWANVQGIPSCVDPKKRQFWAYRGAHLFKPNLKELKDGLGIALDASDKQALHKAMLLLQEKMKVKQVFVTLSEQGVALLTGDQFLHVPAHLRKIADVSGAGDTVISVAALALAIGLSPSTLAEISNLSGGLVCESVGVVSIDKEHFLEEIKSKILAY